MKKILTKLDRKDARSLIVGKPFANSDILLIPTA